MAENLWSDSLILKAIKSPSSKGFEVKIKNPEVTFIGAANQPDLATIYITMYPRDLVIELKSLKLYFYQFRNKIISYERLINVIYDDLMSAYKPVRLRLVMMFLPRGGISSKITIDSDWFIRGGEEKFCDWVGLPEDW